MGEVSGSSRVLELTPGSLSPSRSKTLSINDAIEVELFVLPALNLGPVPIESAVELYYLPLLRTSAIFASPFSPSLS